MNIVLLNNHSLLNAGDHAILLETLDVLEQAFPGARVSLAFNDVPSARAALPGYHILAAPLAQAVRLTPERSYAFAPDARRAAVLAGLVLGALTYRLTGALPPLPHEQRAFLRALAEADMVLACGGGYIYAPSGEQTLGWFTFMILGCLLALVLGRPLVLLPQSIGPLHGARQHLLAAAVARLARLTLVRERTAPAAASSARPTWPSAWPARRRRRGARCWSAPASAPWRAASPSASPRSTGPARTTPSPPRSATSRRWWRRSTPSSRRAPPS
jgi:polysaccharide pyruvyl transferase WcaK-like protein